MSGAKTGAHIPARHVESYQRYLRLAELFDRRFRLPGTSIRFGLDPLLGLVPGVGDLAGAAFAVYGLVMARRLGAPRSLQWRMGWNITLDAVAGSLPLLGDLFDLVFKAHARNLKLLERWLETKHSRPI
jgi:hypothetical protein